jgi:hypothetical protein
MSQQLERRRLDELAEEIGQEVQLAEQAWRDALGHAIKAGQALIEAKSLVKHGQWLPWLKENTSLPERTAQHYMRLARESATVADLPTVRDALAVLAGPSEPESEPTPEPEPEPGPPDAPQTAEQFEAEIVREIGPPPRREDYKPLKDDPVHLDAAEVRYLFDVIDYQRDRQIFIGRRLQSYARAALAEATDSETVMVASALMAFASTGIAFEEAERAAENAEEDEFEAKCRAVGRAERAHQAARDTYYALVGEETDE